MIGVDDDRTRELGALWPKSDGMVDCEIESRADGVEGDGDHRADDGEQKATIFRWSNGGIRYSDLEVDGS